MPLTDRSNVLFGTGFGLLWKIPAFGFGFAMLMIVMALLVTYWYIALPIVVIFVVMFVWAQRRTDKAMAEGHWDYTNRRIVR